MGHKRVWIRFALMLLCTSETFPAYLIAGSDNHESKKYVRPAWNTQDTGGTPSKMTGLGRSFDGDEIKSQGNFSIKFWKEVLSYYFKTGY